MQIYYNLLERSIFYSVFGLFLKIKPIYDGKFLLLTLYMGQYPSEMQGAGPEKGPAPC